MNDFWRRMALARSKIQGISDLDEAEFLAEFAAIERDALTGIEPDLQGEARETLDALVHGARLPIRRQSRFAPN